MLQAVLLVLHVIVAISLIAFILLQQGRGASMGAAFGSGASGTVFGARGSASFLSRATSILAVIFFTNCLVLAYLGSQHTAPTSVLEHLQTDTAPAPESGGSPPTEAAAPAGAGEGAAPPAPVAAPEKSTTDVPTIPPAKTSP